MKKIYILWLAVLLCLFTIAPAFARDITLSWDPSADPSVAGYKVYYQGGSATLPLAGTDATNGAAPIDVGNVTSFTVTGLSGSKVYYSAVSAYAARGLESPLPSEVASQWVPTLPSPANAQASLPANVQLLWSEPPAGASAVTYTLYYGTDPGLSTAAMVVGAANGSGTFGKALFAVIALFGLILPCIPRRRLKRRFAPAAVAAALLLCACGGGSGSGDPLTATLPTGSGGSTTVSSPSNTGSSTSTGSTGSSTGTGTVAVNGLSGTTYDLTNLAPSTTYYWKVVASDGQTTMESATYSFTTTQY